MWDSIVAWFLKWGDTTTRGMVEFIGEWHSAESIRRMSVGGVIFIIFLLFIHIFKIKLTRPGDKNDRCFFKSNDN